MPDRIGDRGGQCDGGELVYRDVNGGDFLDAIEYYYQKLDHYFVTADAHEISALDAGSFPAGSAPA